MLRNVFDKKKTTFEWFLIIISTSVKDHHSSDCQELIEHFISYLRTKKKRT